MFKAASIPLMAKDRFLKLTKFYVWPTIEDAYNKEKSDVYRSVPDPTNIAIDGNFDSPGFSADLCAVAAIEESTHQVIDFVAVQKIEADNVSSRMELEGVKKLLPSIESNVRIGNITLDKHPQVVSFLRNQNYDYGFDPWHRLKGIKKELRKIAKALKNPEEKRQMTMLSKRFIVHVYNSIERSNGDASLCKELVFSFFLHVQGIHEWQAKNFSKLIHAAEGTKVCRRFQEEKFAIVFACPHIEDSTHPDSRHEDVSPNSSPYQLLLAAVAKTTFMGDLDKLRHGNNTSFVESFWNVCIKYRPKRKYFSKNGFIRRTMLASLAFNRIRQAELCGERKISEVYEAFSKAKGEKITKIKKAPINEDWKRNIVAEVIERKRNQGTFDPTNEPEDSDDDEELFLANFDEILHFSDSEDEEVEDPDLEYN